MSTMHLMIESLSARFGFDAEEALRHLEGEQVAKVKLIPMLDGAKVKRAATSYLLYSNELRPQLQSSHPDKKVTELAKLIGASWKALPAEEKEKYESLAAADKVRYQEELSRAEMVPEPKKARKSRKKAPPRPTLAAPAPPSSPASPAPTPALPEPKPKPKAKVSPKAGSILKTVLPYCGKTIEGACDAIRKNHGLYTQCTMPRLGGETLCKTCHRHLQKKGFLAYGTVEGREEMLAEKGLTATRYAAVMRKLNISRAKAEFAAEELGWTIPEQEFVEEKPKGRGRPKKASMDPTVSSSDDSASDAEAPKAPKKKAGRPKGSKKKVVSSAKDGDDLISALLAAAEEREASEDSDPSPEDVAAFLPDEELSPEAQVDVVSLEVDGVAYWRGKDGTLYDPETEEVVGKWDEESNKVLPLPIA